MDDHLATNRTWRPFVPGTGNMDATPKAGAQGPTLNGGDSSVEPLSIRKKAFSPFSPSKPLSSLHRSGDESPTRKQGSSGLPRTQALHKLLPQISTGTPTTATASRSSVTASPTKKLRLPMSSEHAAKLQEAEHLVELALTTKEDVSNLFSNPDLNASLLVILD